MPKRLLSGVVVSANNNKTIVVDKSKEADHLKRGYVRAEDTITKELFMKEAKTMMVTHPKTPNKEIKITEKKIIDSMDDKFEEARYERSIKQNFASSISNKLISELIFN